MGDSTNLPTVPYNVRKVKETGYCDQTDLIVREKAITIYSADAFLRRFF
jgi:hypothetical protein